MEPAGAAVAEQPLELALLEHAEAARKIERPIDDAKRRFHGSMLGRKEPQQPVRPDPAFGPVSGDRFDVRPHRLEIHRDLGYAMLHLRVIDHRPRQRNRRFRLQLLNEHLAGPQPDRVVDVRKIDERPGEKPGDKHVSAGRAGREHARDVFVGHKRAFEYGVVAACRTHPHHVPRLLDRVAFRVARQKEVDNLWRLRIARVHGVPA